MNVSVFLLLIVIIIPVFISLMFTPYWTRRTESFGVSIPEAVYHDPELKAMRKQYVLIMGIFSAAVVVFFLLLGSSFGNNENTISILFSIIIFLYITGSFLVYLKFHRTMKAIKKDADWAKEKSQHIVVDTQFRDKKLTFSNLWFIISFVIVAATMAVTFQQYDQIPDRIPMQYNFSGDVTNWANKSYKAVMIMPIMQVYLTVLFLFVNSIIGRAKQQVSAENPEKSMTQNVAFRRRWSAYIIITGIALTLMFSFIQLSFIYPVNQQLLVIVPLVFGLGVTAGAIVLSFTTGQGGSRVKIAADKSGNAIDRDDDRYWKLGQFYVNKKDPALFLEKRFGVGWTINLAHPITWIILLVIIGLAAGIPLLLGA